MSKLYDSGISAVGPIPSTGLALALAAVTLPTVALVASPPNGRRGATELARSLLRDWDIRSMVLCDGDEPDEARSWSPPAEQRRRLRRALDGLAIGLG